MRTWARRCCRCATKPGERGSGHCGGGEDAEHCGLRAVADHRSTRRTTPPSRRPDYGEDHREDDREDDHRDRRAQRHRIHAEELTLLVLPADPEAASPDDEHNGNRGDWEPGETAEEPVGERRLPWRTVAANRASDPATERAQRIADPDADRADRGLNRSPPRHQARHEREPPEHGTDDRSRCGGTPQEGTADRSHDGIIPMKPSAFSSTESRSKRPSCPTDRRALRWSHPGRSRRRRRHPDVAAP